MTNKSKVQKRKIIYLVKPRGFCAGVKRAVEIVEVAIRKYGVPLYVRHQIVHNRRVVADFEKQGVVFVEKINEVPKGAKIIFSAHGSPPSLYKEALQRGLTIIDATCPLVTKVHLEAKRYEKEGYFIVYLGDKDHPEPKGVLGEIKASSAVLIENLEDAKKLTLSDKKKIVILTQTTLSFDDTKEIVIYLQKQFPHLTLPPAFDICYATQNRQEAVKALAKMVDVILVVGSRESSNSKRLKDLGIACGRPTYLVDDSSQIKENWFENADKVGVTAGASTPDRLISEIVQYIRKSGVAVEELEIIHEQISFALPIKI
ncbi:MAG: 4-hydroxy-3-methylbut-2-enyl diphosphate reductase [Parcubacteria group bacterium GW2011_GWC1_41_7]|nr:MAG: 4-hydroxy-3-methylbut-2-enyl diphosphate reductase [Parcubacteria group bacterium GW2011_GWC1_41_7]